MKSDTEGKGAALELAEVRDRLEAAKGPEYWRSLEELAGTEEFEEMVHREFPRQAAIWDDNLSRRGFLEVAAASLALAGLTGCTRQPAETIVPYVRQPEDIVPGKPQYYATSLAVGGYGLGVLAESHMHRPTKIEGNPDHPASLGATDMLAQASILSLYDPDRSQAVTYLEKIRTWSDFSEQVRNRYAALKALGGKGLRILSGTSTSPTVAARMEALLAEMPEARWHRYEPAGAHGAHEAAIAAFGEPVETRYELAEADVIVALASDFLAQGVGSVRYLRDFASRRRPHVEGGVEGMNRLYSIESFPTSTGTLADHRVALAPSQVQAFAAALASELGVAGAAGASSMDGKAGEWVKAIADDLRAHAGRGAVVAGEEAPAALHVLAAAINDHLGNVGPGKPVLRTEPVAAAPTDHLASIRELHADLLAGEVDTLIILGSNPVYDAPGDLDFAAALPKATFRAHLGAYQDETAAYCQWHVPQAHSLESWGDVRSPDGTASIVQPLIEPLYGGRTALDVLVLLSERFDLTAYEAVREHWQGQGLGGSDFEAAWRRALHDGLIPDTAVAPKVVTASATAVRAAAGSAGAGGGLELNLVADPSVYDGSYANNGWLQEVPKPLTKLTWENALLLSPKTAEAQGLKTGDVALVQLEGSETSVEAPVWVHPGHAPGSATLHLGYGRTRVGRVGNGVGVNAYKLRTAGSTARVSVSRTRGGYVLASTQSHFNIDTQAKEAYKRHLARHGTIAEYEKDPEFVQHMGHHAPSYDESIYPPIEYKGHSWGLAVDLSSCVGCNACIIACQAENNIPVVGKEQVAKGREMQWLRLDRYFEGDLEDPTIHNQPVMCMHCEQAPCEVVCPVAATVHGSEGLNEMVYNRCVGTRYCSNNCPYKVRRFNFLLYNDLETDLLKMARNPDVTVRSRGVMEKCSYCVQRINSARIEAKKESRRIRDGEVRTACQQACPAGAIYFGDLNDESAEVNKVKASPLNYLLIGELGTRPRTSYLAKIRNPNPVLEPAGGDHGTHGEHHA